MRFIPQSGRLAPHASTNWSPYPKLDADTYPKQPWRLRVFAWEELTGLRELEARFKFYCRRAYYSHKGPPLGQQIPMFDPAIEILTPVFNDPLNGTNGFRSLRAQ
ncbi:MAG: hypothetical protein ACXWBP_03275 [Limisphaerales bacterium]